MTFVFFVHEFLCTVDQLLSSVSFKYARKSHLFNFDGFKTCDVWNTQQILVEFNGVNGAVPNTLVHGALVSVSRMKNGCNSSSFVGFKNY